MLTSSWLYAKPISDTLRITPNQLFFQDILSSYQSAGYTLSFIPVKDYSFSNLYYKIERGSLKKGQEPLQEQRIGIKSDGLRRNEKVNYFGGFHIYKTYIDQVAWNLSYLSLDDGMIDDPLYFVVSKPASWNNQTYEFTGGVDFPLNKKITITLGSDLNYSNKYRTEYDPRASITYNNLLFEGVATYHRRHNHFSLGTSYGYSHVRNNIGFSNLDKNRPSNYDIYVKWMIGYGNLQNPTGKGTNRKRKLHSVSLGYNFIKDDRHLLINTVYSNAKNITYNAAISKEDEDIMGRYASNSLSYNLTFLRFINSHKTVKIGIDTYILSGKNHLNTKGGKTYEASKQKIILSSSVNKLRKGLNQSFGVSFNFLNTIQRDALSSTTVQLTRLHAELYAQKEFKPFAKVICLPSLTFGYQQNIQNKLVDGNDGYLKTIEDDDYAGLSLKDFYDNVVYHDLYINSLNPITGSLGCTISFLNSETFNTSIKIDEYVQAAFSEELFRFTTNFSIILDF
ncbi:hypothetical protein R9C00_03770 [Flammeovirgaceae bacterium SG7u.111]|nr:hypothetical protein [Flammeovirgaceae bacterium SG7u.132]WPO36563.1 hypothetical protein R9C00_03770 [Flammeovirgaceae bacterium SG7u.111]